MSSYREDTNKSPAIIKPSSFIIAPPPEMQDFIVARALKMVGFFRVVPSPVPVPKITKRRSQSGILPVDHIVTTIQSARSILDLPDDWDGEGAAAVAPATFERATNFLLDGALQMWKLHGICLDAPDISLVADGSIDLHWRRGERELLVNVPVNAADSPSFYGENAIGQIVKGPLPSTKYIWLLMWLMQ
jgi:hypothetical protein